MHDFLQQVWFRVQADLTQPSAVIEKSETDTTHNPSSFRKRIPLNKSDDGGLGILRVIEQHGSGLHVPLF